MAAYSIFMVNKCLNEWTINWGGGGKRKNGKNKKEASVSQHPDKNLYLSSIDLSTKENQLYITTDSMVNKS